MGAEAKSYLQEHALPQLFESLITGLICNKPEDPIEFLENSLNKVRQNPSFEYKWDSFIDEKVLRECKEPPVKPGSKITTTEKVKKGTKPRATSAKSTKQTDPNRRRTVPSTVTSSNKLSSRPSSTMQNVQSSSIPDVPVILFIGGPGGGKTRHAARIQEALAKFGLVHICMPDIIRAAIAKYQNTDLEWKEAARSYQRGELIPNNLALELVKAEMIKHQDAKVFFLEGFPREARQVENFEREVRPVNMAMILDYDENTLRHHMENRGLDAEVIDSKIREFKLKTLPSAKYFDDQRLLHLIPGEQTDQWIFERMKLLIQRAMELGVPVTTSKVASRMGSPLQRPDVDATVMKAVAIVEAAAATAETSENQSRSPAKGKESGRRENLKLTNSTGKGIGSATSPSLTTKNRGKAATSGSEKPAPKSAPGKSLRKGSDSKRESSFDGNTVTESKPEETKVVSALGSVTETEIRRERTQTSEIIAETFTYGSPTTSVAINDASNMEQSSQSSKQSSSSITKKKSNKMQRTVSQTSKSSETSHRSLYSVKTKSQLMHDVKIETQVAAGPSSELKTNSIVDSRYPRGLPNNASAIIIVGPPGSGKAEISKRIAKRYFGFAYLGMGDLLRKEVEANSDDHLWQRIGKKMDAGEPVPTKICRELLYSKIYEEDTICSGYVIEGYPRTKNQAIDFENQIDRLTSVILIDCTEEFCIEAIEKRTKEDTVLRPDDSSEATIARLQMFKLNTLPMLKYFDDKGNLKVIDGDSNLDKIFEEIVEELDGMIGLKKQ